MQNINGIPQVVEGVAYYSSVTIPKPDFNGEKNLYIVNLAVSDDVFQKFQDAGYNCGMKPAGRASFTEDPVITFQQWELGAKGKPNRKPRLVDQDKNDVDVALGNGSKVAVQWRHSEYGDGKYRRPILENVQIIDLIEYLGDTAESGDSGGSLAF